MLRDAVIPDRQIVLLPAPAHLELRFGDVREQEAKQRLTLFFRYVHDARGEPFIHKQRLLSGHRMGTHHRVQQRGMFCDRIQPALVLLFAFAVLVLRERFFEVMLRPQAAQQGLERRGERLKRCDPAGPQRIPPPSPAAVLLPESPRLAVCR